MQPPGPPVANPQLPRSPLAMLMFALPLLGIVVVMSLYGLTILIGMQGRGARGAAVDVTFAGCAEAQPVLAQRLALMGLDDARFSEAPGGFTLRITLPGDPTADANLPTMLARVGDLAIEPLTGGAPLLTTADLIGAELRQDITATPWTVLKLAPETALAVAKRLNADPVARYAVRIDGQTVGHLEARAGASVDGVEYLPDAESDLARLYAAADQWIVLAEGPLPCPLTVRDVQPVAVATP